jgi:hypothetical protein
MQSLRFLSLFFVFAVHCEVLVYYSLLSLRSTCPYRTATIDCVLSTFSSVQVTSSLCLKRKKGLSFFLILFETAKLAGAVLPENFSTHPLWRIFFPILPTRLSSYRVRLAPRFSHEFPGPPIPSPPPQHWVGSTGKGGQAANPVSSLSASLSASAASKPRAPTTAHSATASN